MVYHFLRIHDRLRRGRRIGDVHKISRRLESWLRLGTRRDAPHAHAVAASRRRSADGVSLVWHEHLAHSGDRADLRMAVATRRATYGRATRRRAARQLSAQSVAEGAVRPRAAGSVRAPRMVWLELVPERACDCERFSTDDAGHRPSPRERMDVALLRLHPDHRRQPVFARLPRRTLANGCHRGSDRRPGVAGGVDVRISEAEAGVRVEMMKIESDPNFQKIGSTRNTSLRISNLCFLNAEPQRCAEPQRACKTDRIVVDAHRLEQRLCGSAPSAALRQNKSI